MKIKPSLAASSLKQLGWLIGLTIVGCGSDSSVTTMAEDLAKASQALDSGPAATCLAVSPPQTVDMSQWFAAGTAPQYYTFAASGPSATYSATASNAQVFGTEMTTIGAAPFLKQTLRFGATLDGQNLSDWGSLWMRVDDEDGKVLTFDNLEENAPLSAASPNKSPMEVALYVPAQAARISFGLLLAGNGTVNISAPYIQVVQAPGGEMPIDFVQATGYSMSDANHESADPNIYTSGFDNSVAECGQASAYVASTEISLPASNYGTLLSSLPGRVYAGQRLRLSGDLKTANAGGAALFMNLIDGNGYALSEGLSRSLSGTQDFTGETIVLDVPTNIGTISLGFYLSGSGQVWANDVRLDVVDSSVPVTAPQD